MKTNLQQLLFASTSLLLIGCGGGSSDEYNYTPQEEKQTLYKMAPQEGTQNYLFYGETNPKSLGALNNVRIIGSDAPQKILIDNNDTSDIRYPVSSTTMIYNTTNNHYSNLYVKAVSYLSGGKAYVVPMQKGSTPPVAIQNSSAGTLSDAGYTKIDYLGTTQYLVAHDDENNETVLITPDMGPNDTPVHFENKKLLSVTYPSYGEAIDGYLVYDNDLRKVQKCDLSMQCQTIDINVGSRDFEADVAGTTLSTFIDDNRLYTLDKATLEIKDINLSVNIASGHGTTSFQGKSFYFIGEDQNLYSVDVLSSKITKITPQADERLERIRGFTTDYVIFGSDTLLQAAKKDGSSSTPVTLVENTRTSGYKYVTNYGIGDVYLFVTYNLDTTTNDTQYQACVFDKEAKIECKENSFWAGATLKKEGERNFESSFTYTPYAYVRVDNTDNFGGGDLKAIDPAHPLDDGITMGSIASYNFQTFLTNSRYIDETIDGDGGVIFYAKNDENFHVDAFYFNLLKENSLVQLTNTDPLPDVTQGRDHCHGRHCMICHNLGGGKIYTDIQGSRSAYGYRIRLDFEDGTQTLADVAKGKGENFSLPLKKFVGNFKANVIDQNGTVVNNSAGYYHEGIQSADCNYCHARDGKTRYDAPGVISATR